MKKLILSLGFSLAISGVTFGQLYSSGNNVITGNHVGIGVNAPLARLHIYQKPNPGGGSGVPHLILQNKWTDMLGTSDYSWTVSAGTGLNFSGSSVANGNVEGAMSLHKGGLNVGYIANAAVNAGGNSVLGTFAQGSYTGLGVVRNTSMSSGWGLSSANGGALLYSDLSGNLEFWSANSAPLGLNASNHKHMVLTNTGNLGIGITTPVEKLEVKGNAVLENTNANLILKNNYDPSTSNTPIVRFQNEDNTVNWTVNGTIAGVHAFSITHTDAEDNESNFFHIDTDGRIGIGTTNTPSFHNNQGQDYRLFVKGGIKTEEIKVELCTGSWCDYVFAPDYNLLPLSEVEKTIQETGHLHKIASADEIEKNGLELKSMTINQQEKIEELFLHLIEMDKRMKALEKENAELRNNK